MKTAYWILLALILMACSPTLNAVDYDDLYATRHYIYPRSYFWYQYGGPYLQQSLYYNYGFNSWFYPQDRIIIQKMYVPQNQERTLTPGRRPDRESIHTPTPRSGRGTRRD